MRTSTKQYIKNVTEVFNHCSWEKDKVEEDGLYNTKKRGGKRDVEDGDCLLDSTVREEDNYTSGWEVVPDVFDGRA